MAAELGDQVMEFYRAKRSLPDPDEWMRKGAEELGLPVPRLTLSRGAGHGAEPADADPKAA